MFPPLSSSPFQPFLSPELKKQQDLFKAQKALVTSSLSPPKPSLAGHKLSFLADKHSNLFLSSTLLGQQRNGVIQTAVQDAPPGPHHQAPRPGPQGPRQAPPPPGPRRFPVPRP